MPEPKPYRLYITQTSLFARKARMVVHERGLAGQIDEIDAHVRTPENEVLAISPLGKVPTLAGPDGLMLVDSTIICEFLDRLADPPTLHHDVGAARWAASGPWALAEGLMDSLAWRARELRRPLDERSPSFLAYEKGRQARVYDWLEAHLPFPGPAPNVRDISAIGLAVALDYANYRFPEDAWRKNRPALAAWFDLEATRSAFQATIMPPK